MKNRLSTGGSIDRNRPLNFTFNNRQLTGYAGDTIASALLANNVRVVSRSFKYHRPRGIYSAGAEEPSAIFTVGQGGYETPNVRATLTPLVEGMYIRSASGWPSVNFDIGSITGIFSRLLPAGFYYKTFMKPAKLWMFYEKIIRRAASSVPSPKEIDADSYVHQHAHCDVLIIGGGAAGLAAARALAGTTTRVILADMMPVLGGQLLDSDTFTINGDSANAWLTSTRHTLNNADNITVLTQTTIQAYHDYNYLIGAQTLSPTTTPTRGARQRLWKIRARQVIIAAGAIERPLVFTDNDVPGVMLSSAVQSYIHRYGVLPGRHILFFTNNDSAYPVALAALEAGAQVDIVDIRIKEESYWRQQALDKKIPVHCGTGIVGIRPNGNFLSVKFGQIRDEMTDVSATHTYDVVAVSGGWVPTVHLFSQARGTLRWNTRLAAFQPDSAHPLNACTAVGAANGSMDLGQCLREGHVAGCQAAEQNGHALHDENAHADVADAPPVEQPAVYLPLIPTVHPVGQGTGKHFVDLMNDVTAADIYLAVREGYESVEHMKRYTAAGFGTDQGKTGNINALTILARALSTSPATVGHTTYRPQYTPMSFGVVTGGDRRQFFAQQRTTAIDSWHRQQHAVYEDVGDWRRPRYFPRGSENMNQAVWRECKATRHDVAIMDASTLGKIDIQGEDAAQFLDMIYTNQFSTLPVGRCRYGLMLRETGMVFDDGVTARLADSHFHMTTSTGHAAAVMNWLEEWLQTEWPHFRVFCTSVTEQWTVIAVAGPKARQLLAEVTDLPLTAADFPFMSFQEGVVAGAPARVFRISFSGEASFEINVPASYGLSVWETLFEKGEPYGLTPYGTESMHVLRAEKGFIIVGQDSDGSMIPPDVGLSWMVSKKKKDFIGCRSLARPDMQRPGRPQLVGLLTTDPQVVIPEGAHLLSQQDSQPPMTADGFVTSSYMSPTLERSIALAIINDGTHRIGETVYAVMMDQQRIEAKITDSVFYDKEGQQLHG